MSLAPLTDDEAELVYHVTQWGSDGYPIERRGRLWAWRDWRGVRGAPNLFKTKAGAIRAFEAWFDLALERWREMRQVNPRLMLTAVGIREMG